MTLINALKQASLKENTKGGMYYQTSYNANLDLFCGISRFNSDAEITLAFNNALAEDRGLAVANLLYLLDIRAGKGERHLFKVCMRELCLKNLVEAKQVLDLIPSLGRYDYLMVAFKTPLEEYALELIKRTLESDLECEYPTLLAKWLPSHRAHAKNSPEAKLIREYLGLSERDYRKMLATLRAKLNIIEHNITAKSYSGIDFSRVPTKAMLRYSSLFMEHCPNEFNAYKDSVLKGDSKINTAGLFCYEIVKRSFSNRVDRKLLEAMWENQRDVFKTDKNILVMADVSGSMTCYDALPYASSVGLAIYTAEHNTGIFKNHFMTFTSKPRFEEVHGEDIVDKIRNIHSYCQNTNIDAAFELLLTAAKKENITDSEMPSHIIIISDMEFDDGIYSKGGTNFSGWRDAYKEAGYTMPKIIFWNVAGRTSGVPATKFDNDCVMVSGFSTSILTKLLDIDEFTPYAEMLEVLKPYLDMLQIESSES